jgi:hypothetical protein
MKQRKQGLIVVRYGGRPPQPGQDVCVSCDHGSGKEATRDTNIEGTNIEGTNKDTAHKKKGSPKHQ